MIQDFSTSETTQGRLRFDYLSPARHESIRYPELLRNLHTFEQPYYSFPDAISY